MISDNTSRWSVLGKAGHWACSVYDIHDYCLHSTAVSCAALIFMYTSVYLLGQGRFASDEWRNANVYLTGQEDLQCRPGMGSSRTKFCGLGLGLEDPWLWPWPRQCTASVLRSVGKTLNLWVWLISKGPNTTIQYFKFMHKRTRGGSTASNLTATDD